MMMMPLHIRRLIRIRCFVLLAYASTMLKLATCEGETIRQQPMYFPVYFESSVTDDIHDPEHKDTPDSSSNDTIDQRNETAQDDISDQDQFLPSEQSMLF